MARKIIPIERTFGRIEAEVIETASRCLWRDYKEATLVDKDVVLERRERIVVNNDVYREPVKYQEEPNPLDGTRKKGSVNKDKADSKVEDKSEYSNYIRLPGRSYG